VLAFRHFGNTLAGILVTAAASGPAAAQQWQLDLGASRVRYDTAAATGSVYLTPTFEWSGPLVYAALTGTATRTEGSQWSGEGRGALAAMLPLRPGSNSLRLQLAGAGGGTSTGTGYRSATAEGGATLHWSSRRGGVWAGVGAASAWASTPGTWISAFQPTAGAWIRPGVVTLSAGWSPFRLEGWWFNQVDGRLTAVTGPFEAEVYAGWRGAPAASGVKSANWAGGNVAWWATRWLAVTGSGGSYPSDLLQGLPRGRYVAVGLRLSTRHRYPLPLASNSQIALFQSLGHAAESGVFRFRVPGASRVDVVGDWTGWEPMPLERGPDGSWVMRAKLSPGTYRFSLVADGDRWVLPEGYDGVDDGYGDKVSIIVITE
jgi:AMP-activated protein kinase-like protein